MKKTRAIIKRAFDEFRPALAFSGGGDSTVLLDIVTGMGYKPQLIWADSQMEYPETGRHVKAVAKKYGLDLQVGKAPITPQECWSRYGFPMQGKQAARLWMQRHRDRAMGFKMNVTVCCRKMKIEPGRKTAKALGYNAMLTGQRGAQDDRLRSLRSMKDGAVVYVKEDAITNINPLDGWTDAMVARYTRQHNLPIHPARTRGAKTIGCMYCGGGAQFDNSGFRVLRQTNKKAWERMVVRYEFGPIILAIKYDRPLQEVQEALQQLGGLERVAADMPHIFDFTRTTPLKGYDR